ncbi:MAG: DegT/DnrJ/EryC1/StrS family aminotransferase [Candidatus Marinimicrobia bacterium]|nr:DegT/DnrJ/EryC1/StrS family aminotransferase [Candidatus Neomarinimicrobiota bacterium]
MSDKIFVTRPSLPPLIEFNKYLKDIWQNKKLTNNGKYHQEFEQKLCEYLGVKYCSLVANGTLGLILSLQALRITGEVITTPFSFIATTHALHWNGITPVFCDISPETLNINPENIEALITPKTTAILPVHVYGNPADVDKIQKIADTYGLKVIYDAAHAFGVKVNGNSILNFGDLSVLSFHATKVFNTFEGGAIITNNEKMKHRIDFLKNFGFADEVTIVGPGINGKMNEFQAALGLLQLKSVDENINKCKVLVEYYRQKLAHIPGINFIENFENTKHNYSYFPILVDKVEYGKDRDAVYEHLKRNNIYARRYFYPLISQTPTYRGLPSARPGNLPVAEKIVKQVICLPIYPDLDLENVERICKIIRQS